MPTHLLQRSSPAKLNLFLEVHGKRNDGFHNLETLMVRTRFGDTMRFESTDSGNLALALDEDSSIASDSFPLDESNLILRAARALQAWGNIDYGAKISVCKRIPSTAGLAGGSSNAAKTLLALNELWALDLPRPALHEIAATLGSDINFFVEDCRAAICRQRGELVEPVPLGRNLHFVVARPLLGNSTPKVFSELGPIQTQRSVTAILHALNSASPQKLAATMFNRLTNPACVQNSGMAELLKQMQKICRRPAMMSGSGSTCFVLANSAREARRLLRQLDSLETSFLQHISV